MNHTTRIVRIPACEQHAGLQALVVEIPWYCIHCKKPRGEPFETLSFDGSRRLGVHGWNNPCGHVERYSEVRQWLETRMMVRP
jgi:hypothetical protein